VAVDGDNMCKCELKTKRDETFERLMWHCFNFASVLFLIEAVFLIMNDVTGLAIFTAVIAVFCEINMLKWRK